MGPSWQSASRWTKGSMRSANLGKLRATCASSEKALLRTKRFQNRATATARRPHVCCLVGSGLCTVDTPTHPVAAIIVKFLVWFLTIYGFAFVSFNTFGMTASNESLEPTRHFVVSF